MQTASTLELAIPSTSGKLNTSMGVILQSLSDKLVSFLISFQVKLRLENADIKHFSKSNEVDILRIAFPDMAEAEFAAKDRNSVAIRMLYVIRLYAPEIADVLGKLEKSQPAPAATTRS